MIIVARSIACSVLVLCSAAAQVQDVRVFVVDFGPLDKAAAKKKVEVDLLTRDAKGAKVHQIVETDRGGKGTAANVALAASEYLKQAKWRTKNLGLGKLEILGSEREPIAEVVVRGVDLPAECQPSVTSFLRARAP